MPIRSRTYLESKFENGDVPNEDDFTDIFDSFFHKDEDTIPQTKVENLPPLEETISGSGSIVVPAGLLVISIVLLPTSGGSFTIGSTAPGSEYDGGTLSGTTPYRHTSQYYFLTATTIYFTGNFDVKIFLR
jgi:hypothetical protein